MEDFVVILGSGNSINNLTTIQRKLIDNCNVKIGINKYSTFYDKAQIRPTHIYFLDDYDNKTIKFFIYMIKKLKTDKLQRLNIIVSERYRNCLNNNFFRHYFIYITNLILSKTSKFLIFFGYILISRFNYNIYCKYKSNIKKIFPYKNKLRFFLISKSWKLEYLTINSWKDSSVKWANSIKQPMFHYRGSLTTVLNYVAIKFPNKKILFVGVDLNTATYFFEKELNELNLESNDWTTSISKQENKHFSIINHEGTKIDDVFIKIIDNLKKTGNTIYSINKESYLVEQGFIESIML